MIKSYKVIILIELFDKIKNFISVVKLVVRVIKKIAKCKVLFCIRPRQTFTIALKHLKLLSDLNLTKINRERKLK